MNRWNTTRQALPDNREQVQFIVTGHEAWLTGIYESNCFRSRWATYTAAEVKTWRKMDATLRSRTPNRVAPDGLYWSERRMRES